MFSSPPAAFIHQCFLQVDWSYSDSSGLMFTAMKCCCLLHVSACHRYSLWVFLKAHCSDQVVRGLPGNAAKISQLRSGSSVGQVWFTRDRGKLYPVSCHHSNTINFHNCHTQQWLSLINDLWAYFFFKLECEMENKSNFSHCFDKIMNI